MPLDKKNIVYIVNSLNLGGTENLVVQMSKAFNGEYRLSVICLDEPGIWTPKLRDEGIPVYCLWRQPGLDISMAYKIARYCRTYNIDLIHAHQCTPWFYAALSRLLYREPLLLFEEHGRHYPEQYSWKKNLVNKLLTQNMTSTIVAVSEDVRQRLVKYEGVSSSRVQIIYNGVHPPTLLEQAERNKLRRELGFSEKDFVIGAVGRLDPIKNLPMLVKAITRVHSQERFVKGLLVGDGPDYDLLQTLCHSLDVNDIITMAGYRHDAVDLLQCMDVFVLCSFSEGTSMALLEAMACGIPVIVTAVGGNPEVITKDYSGWVVPSDSIEDLCGAITQAMDSPNSRVNMAQNAQKDFERRFTMKGMIKKYRNLYRNLLNLEGV